MMKLSGWKHRLEAFAATRRKAVETQSSHRREGAGRHKNTPGPPVNGENISLDVPFYRTFPTAPAATGNIFKLQDDSAKVTFLNCLTGPCLWRIRQPLV